MRFTGIESELIVFTYTKKTRVMHDDLLPCVFQLLLRCKPQNAIDEVMRHPHIATARRLHALLDVLDILTEKPTLTESDMAALDVILDAARRQVSEIIWLSEQSPKGMAG